VRIWKFCARPSVGESPACRQAAGTLPASTADSVSGQRQQKK